MTHSQEAIERGVALLPCPFCGSRAEVVHTSHIRCTNTYNCDAETRLGVKTWNRRAIKPIAAGSVKAWKKVSKLVEEYAEAAHTNSLGAYESCLMVHKIAKRQIAALEAAKTIAAGSVVVPREPTEAMIVAADNTYHCGYTGTPFSPSEDVWKAMIAAAPLTAAPGAVVDDEIVEACADDLRAKGLTVAVHNDYRLNGERCTFWLFVDGAGMSYKGEGQTDAVALNQVRAAFAAINGGK